MTIIELEKILIKGEAAIRCTNEEEARKTLSFFYRLGYEWKTSERWKTHFSRYKESTCYVIENGRIMFGPSDFFESRNTKIIKYTEIEHLFTPKGLYEGMFDE